MSRHSWVQTAPSFSKATLCSQINPVLFFPDKAATFNSRIKSPKSQHWHLAKATEERAEQWDLMLHWLLWPTERECAGPGGKIKKIFTHTGYFVFFMQLYCVIWGLQVTSAVISQAALNKWDSDEDSKCIAHIWFHMFTSLRSVCSECHLTWWQTELSPTSSRPKQQDLLSSSMVDPDTQQQHF